MSQEIFAVTWSILAAIGFGTFGGLLLHKISSTGAGFRALRMLISIATLSTLSFVLRAMVNLFLLIPSLSYRYNHDGGVSAFCEFVIIEIVPTAAIVAGLDQQCKQLLSQAVSRSAPLLDAASGSERPSNPNSTTRSL